MKSSKEEFQNKTPQIVRAAGKTVEGVVRKPKHVRGQEEKETQKGYIIERMEKYLKKLDLDSLLKVYLSVKDQSIK